MAAKLAEYALPTVPAGAEAVMMASGAGAIVTGMRIVAVTLLESVAVTVTVKVPAVSGVPLNAPAEFAVIPDGSPVTVQV